MTPRLRQPQARKRCGWQRCAALVALIALVVLGGLPASSPVAAAPAAIAEGGERALERRVKAAYLVRFTEFVTWPEGAFGRMDAPFLIAVAGRGAFLDELRQIVTGRRVGGRTVELKRVTEGETMPSAQILLIPDSEKPRLREWIRAAPRHALIVTESDGALAYGSVINFALVEGRVRFEASLPAAEKRGLQMSSRLLALALNVRSTAP